MGLLLRLSPLWATATCGFLLLATILLPIPVIRRLVGLIDSSQGPPERLEKAKRVVVGLFLRSILAASCLLALGISLALRHRPFVVLDFAIALLFVSTLFKIAAGVAMSREIFGSMTEKVHLAAIGKEIAKSIDDDVKWLRSGR